MLTTTPARLMTPTPVMMMPKGVAAIISPQNTPISERITEVRIMKGVMVELN